MNANKSKLEIEEVMDVYDKLFETLVMPTAFLMSITWSFLFFLGYIEPSSDWFKTQFFDLYIFPLASQLAAFVVSILSWGMSVLFRYKKTKVGWWKLKGYQKLAKGFKKISINLLWISIILVPFPLFYSVLAKAIGQESALGICFLIFVFVLYIAASLSNIETKDVRAK